MEGQSTVTTLLFTDIEGSTELWAREPERMPAALARHDALTRAAVEQHGGTVVKTTGDGAFALFPDPLDALGAALQLQLALREPAATEGLPLRVRCGLHAGVVERRGNDCFGTAVNRGARIAAAAHGGQVLLSQAVWALVAERLPAGVALQDQGTVRLRDVARPERLHQLVHPGLRRDFPPLRSLEHAPGNLPLELSTFVGRAAELTEARRLLHASRLLTVVGAGGIGKTRLSLRVAGDVRDAYPDGVWFVELAPIVDPALVPSALAKAIGIGAEPNTPLVEALAAYLRPRRALLVLDNCEHLLGACARLAEALLRAAPQIRILASSREPLHLPGEQTYPLPPLSLPAEPTAADAVSRSDAVRLFVERARLQQPRFAITARNSGAVARICAGLDGIPLALELAAARVAALPVETIAARLGDRLRILVGGDRTAPPRQQTLRASIEWSYDLLDAAEKTLFARLSVFANGWTLGEAEAVTAGGGIAAGDVLDLLAGLVDKSLAGTGEDGGRYRMLAAIRQYADERLREGGEHAAVSRRHRDCFLALAEEAERHVDGGAEQPAWLARLDLEHDNLRAALGWSLEAPDGADAGLRLCSALCRYWSARGHAGEGAAWCARALARDAASAETRARARVLDAAGVLAWRLGDMTAAQRWLEQALASSRRLGDRTTEAEVLANLGGVATHRADFAVARSMLEQAIALHRELGNRAQEADAYNSLAALALSEGDDEAARAPLERALAIVGATGNRLAEARAAAYQGLLAERRDDYAAAQALHERALAIAREFGVREFELVEIRHLADVAMARGDLQAARAHFLEALVASRDLGNRHRMAEMLEAAMDLTVAAGAFRRGAVLAGAAHALRAVIATPRAPLQRRQHDPLVARCREALGESDYAAAFAAGQALSGDAAVAETIAWLEGA